MRSRTAVTAVTAVALLACTLTACDALTSTPEPDAHAVPTSETSPPAPATPDPGQDDAMKAAGIPPEPTGDDRLALLETLSSAAPDVVRYEEKAVDAARNQCGAINGGADKLDWLASQRFSYHDVTTTEGQGAKLNAALKASGFCKL
ncbi:hypothetical protein ACIQPQ_13560 [Streptomyces sp. NPDC091281]|uniref:hypothetical protein n=1 Tax=Streptomyces sp. NPDC091281 TaxID=3365985 RepID=UPI0037FA6B53